MLRPMQELEASTANKKKTRKEQAAGSLSNFTSNVAQRKFV